MNLVRKGGIGAGKKKESEKRKVGTWNELKRYPREAL